MFLQPDCLTDWGFRLQAVVVFFAGQVSFLPRALGTTKGEASGVSDAIPEQQASRFHSGISNVS